MYHNILYENAIKDIQTGEVEKIVSAVKSLRESGKPEAVKNVIEVLRNSQDDSIVKECVRFLNDIKDPKGIDPLMEEINEPSNKPILHHLVSSAWQNDLDYTNYINDFIKVLLHSDYLAAYESFTVIENHLEKLDPETLQQIQAIIEGQITKISKEKQPMVSELSEMISKWPTQ